MKVIHLLYEACVTGILIGAIVTTVIIGTHKPRTSELQFDGKTYVVFGLQGIAHTHKYHCPVYVPVLLKKEDTKFWIKK